ncbi:MAG TPA: hypothetical protein VII61_22750 [Ktedonobacteraceae bacterium]
MDVVLSYGCDWIVWTQPGRMDVTSTDAPWSYGRGWIVWTQTSWLYGYDQARTQIGYMM